MTSPTSAKNWRKRTGGHELELPSGNMCLVKRPGMQKLLTAGIMPDSLTPIAMQHIAQAESGGRSSKSQEAKLEKELMDKVMQDPAQLTEMMQSFDKVVAMCVVEPKVRVHWYTETDEQTGHLPADAKVGDDIPDDVRDDEILYTDDVDDEDKHFIFQYVVGGSSDLEEFRQEQTAAMENSSAVKDVSGPAKRTSRARK